MVSVAWSRRMCGLIISSVWSENMYLEICVIETRNSTLIYKCYLTRVQLCVLLDWSTSPSLFYQSWWPDPDLSAASPAFCTYDAPRLKVQIISVSAFHQLKLRWSSRHRCRTISQSKQVIHLAARQKDNVAEHMCTRSRAPSPPHVVAEPILSGPTGVKWKGAIFV